MRIIRFSYYDKTRNWGFENLEFLKLTLLVGASGVGKTQILRAIENIIQVSDGTSFNGITWDITFESINGKTYRWNGEFEKQILTLLNETGEAEEKPVILNEQLTENGNRLIQRDKDKILFQGKETVKLAPHQSSLYLLKAEPVIEEAQNELSNLKMIEGVVGATYIISMKNQIEKILPSHDNIDKLINSKLRTGFKLILASKLKDKTLFQSIKQRFTDIFPQIENIRIEKRNRNEKMDIYVVQFSEKGVENWISPEDMSSGMVRSFNQICELYLSPEGSVLLMDEFENSLGVNCIDELTNDILSSRRNIQFILTSHHPYIINNIPYQNWKIVTRKAGKVTVKSASDYRIGESKHDYFMQLLQLDDFSNGVD